MHEGPRFNLKAVVQQTGLKPDTLRAWERRYGLIMPERSEGGHRLYSQRDIDTIRWLMARQRDGLSIKRATDLWHQIEGEGQDPLRVQSPLSSQAMPVPIPRPLGASVTQLREEWVAACLSYDEPRAEQLLAEAFAYYSPETVLLELLQKAVSQIGDEWYRGFVTVQQEHFASALAIRRLGSLVMAAPPPIRPGRILAACPPEENHVISLLLLTVLLRRRGWEVIYLGANVPVERLEATVGVTKPQLVILAAQQLHTAASLLEMAQRLQQEGVLVAYGGLIFNVLPQLRGRIPGHFLGEHLNLAPQVTESLMVTPRPASAAGTTPEACLRARDHFRERQGLIEAHLVQELMPMGISTVSLDSANQELGRDICAALTLGDMGFLDVKIAWMEGFRGDRHLPTEMLPLYFQTYYRTAREQLDERGAPIVSWFRTMLQESNAKSL